MLIFHAGKRRPGKLDLIYHVIVLVFVRPHENLVFKKFNLECVFVARKRRLCVEGRLKRRTTKISVFKDIRMRVTGSQ